MRIESNQRGYLFRENVRTTMLKLLGSYALARLLGGGLVLALVIYLILTMLGR